MTNKLVCHNQGNCLEEGLMKTYNHFTLNCPHSPLTLFFSTISIRYTNQYKELPDKRNQLLRAVYNRSDMLCYVQQYQDCQIHRIVQPLLYSNGCTIFFFIVKLCVQSSRGHCV